MIDIAVAIFRFNFRLERAINHVKSLPSPDWSLASILNTIDVTEQEMTITRLNWLQVPGKLLKLSKTNHFQEMEQMKQSLKFSILSYNISYPNITKIIQKHFLTRYSCCFQHLVTNMSTNRYFFISVIALLQY